MYGMDISSYQKTLDLQNGNYDFCIIKATEGIGFVDNSFFNFAGKLKSMDKLIGCYHFARPDYHKTQSTMVKEATWFISQVEKADLLGKAILVLDWEREPFDNEQLVTAWVNTVKEYTGVVPFIYGSKSKLSKWKDWGVYTSCPLWMAAWPTIERVNVGYPIDIPKKSIPWRIWQYSSTGVYPGFNGKVDCDYSDLTREEWIKLAGGETKENITDDMQWAIDIGLFKGHDNGLFRPQDALTREELATVLRRYDSMDHNKY